MKIKDLIEKIDYLRTMYPMLDEYDFDVMLDSNNSEVENEEGNVVVLDDYTIKAKAYSQPLELRVSDHQEVTLTNEIPYKF